jgi:Ser/Thr protein kinase RdoA (MazF antagonist)
MVTNVLDAYGLNAHNCTVVALGSGLINSTWKVSAGDGAYILQCINNNIFKSSQAIANNLEQLKNYLKITSPDYLFASPLATTAGDFLVMDDGQYYRLLPFIENSHTVDVVSQPEQAYEAAKQFGKFSRLLNDFDASQLQYTLPDFHNLKLRVLQFQSALTKAEPARLAEADKEIPRLKLHSGIVNTYNDIITNKTIPLRVIHHDTKINNVLFDYNNKGLCVIDLDTVMPGYFISDVGDMMRTYLSPANEEEQDLSKVYIRQENLTAIYQGYMDEMGDILTPAEKKLFYYSGEFMIYMQAVRFLTDYLNGDVYYHTSYPGQNLLRAKNQLCLLEMYVEAVRS